jgi:hypothetical protein
VLEEEHGVRIGSEAVRRALHELGFAWRRNAAIGMWLLKRLLLGHVESDSRAGFRDCELHLKWLQQR